MNSAQEEILALLQKCNAPFSSLRENLAKQMVWVKLQELDYWVKLHQASEAATISPIVAPTGAQVMELKK